MVGAGIFFAALLLPGGDCGGVAKPSLSGVGWCNIDNKWLCKAWFYFFCRFSGPRFQGSWSGY